MSSAAAAPCARRQPISIAGLTASAAASDATAKPAEPATNIRLRPYRSPSLAPVIRPIAKARAYPPMIHCSAAVLACSSVLMAGAATFTMVPSSRSMHSAASTRAKTAHLRGWPPAVSVISPYLFPTIIPNNVRYCFTNTVLHCLA